MVISTKRFLQLRTELGDAKQPKSTMRTTVAIWTFGPLEVVRLRFHGVDLR
jgi:hypothetical protein